MAERATTFKSEKPGGRFRYDLSKMSDREIQEMMDSVMSDIESEDDSVLSGDFFDDEPIEIPEFTTMTDPVRSADVSAKPSPYTVMVQDASQEPGPSTSSHEYLSPQTDEVLMPGPISVNHPRFKGKRAKRPRSPPPEYEEAGPSVRPNNGGFIGNVSQINAKSAKSAKSKQVPWSVIMVKGTPNPEIYSLTKVPATVPVVMSVNG